MGFFGEGMMGLRHGHFKFANSVTCIAMVAAVSLASAIPAYANDFWRHSQARNTGLESASAMLNLRIPFGGSVTSNEEPTFGLLLAAGSTRYSEFQAHRFNTNRFGDAIFASPALSETPFFQTGITLQGKPFVKYEAMRMAPLNDGRVEFFDGDMDGGELFILGGVIIGALAILYYLSDGFEGNEEVE